MIGSDLHLNRDAMGAVRRTDSTEGRNEYRGSRKEAVAMRDNGGLDRSESVKVIEKTKTKSWWDCGCL